VVVAPSPVEDEGRGARLDRAVEDVVDRALDLLNIDDSDLTETTMIGGLPTTLRVEQGVVEDGVGPALHLPGRDDLDLELSQVGVCLVGGSRLGRLGHRLDLRIRSGRF